MPTSQSGVRRALESSIAEAGRINSHVQPGASVSLLLATGGDSRIALDAVTGRNRYGTRTTPADDEISFASSTASNVSSAGYAAASREWQRLIDGRSQAAIGIDGWFEGIREQIRHGLGRDSAEVILAASGTDAEVVALSIVTRLSKRPLTNIFIAPDETGNGVPRAAAGLHFSDQTALGFAVEPGTPIAGLSPERIEVRSIALRQDSGQPRPHHEIDGDLVQMVEQELKRDRDVAVHVLDTSKTGLTGVTREAARAVAELAPGRVRVIIDACQLRCPFAQLRQDLDDGFLVALTGSKFIAAPPFAGAVMLPASIVQELGSAGDLAAGLGDYSAAQDWPPLLRDFSASAFKSEMNFGLGLRWIAGIANLERFSATNEAHHNLIRAHFVRLVRSRIRRMKGLALHPDDDGEHLVARSILPLTVLTSNGAFGTFEEAVAIQTALRSPEHGPICHVGQPVRIGSRVALRVSASANDISSASQRMSAGLSLEDACRPLETHLDALFAKWSACQLRVAEI